MRAKGGSYLDPFIEVLLNCFRAFSRWPAAENDVIKQKILETKKSEKNFREYGRLLNREGSVLKQLNQPAFGLGMTIKLHHELIALLEGMLTTNRAPDLFISYKVYGPVEKFTKMTCRPSYYDVGFIMKAVFKDVLSDNKGGPAGWAKKGVARFLELKQNETKWKKALASFERGLLHNRNVNPPLRGDFSKPMPFTVEPLGDGKYLIQVKPKSPDADPLRNTITLKPRSLASR